MDSNTCRVLLAHITPVIVGAVTFKVSLRVIKYVVDRF